MKAPEVSVVLIAYNLKKYVGEAIQSVLDQTFTNFELIIVDDGSTDGTKDVIDTFVDPRIQKIYQENQGPSGALNTGIWASRGQYIAIFSGDDVNYPSRLETQLELARSHKKKVLFSEVTFIGEDSEPIEKPAWMSDFKARQLTQEELIRELFFKGNFLNAVTAFIERETLLQCGSANRVGPFHPGLFQIQDFELWMQLAKKCDFLITQRPLIKYRTRAGHANLSNPTKEKVRCHRFEHQVVAEHFFEGISDELFQRTFKSELVIPNEYSELARLVNEAHLYFRSSSDYFIIIGIKRLIDLMAEPGGMNYLSEKLNFNLRSLSKMMGQYEFSVISDEAAESSLYIDTGRGFKEENRIIREGIKESGPFEYYFDIRDFSNRVQLRWDPIEGVFCKVTNLCIEMLNIFGQWISVPNDQLTTNGVFCEGEFLFLNKDPMIMFSQWGKNSQSCRIKGYLEVIKPFDSKFLQRPKKRSKFARFKTLFARNG